MDSEQTSEPAWDDLIGPCVDPAGVADRLPASLGEVARLTDAGHLLALTAANGQTTYPLFQFTDMAWQAMGLYLWAMGYNRTLDRSRRIAAWLQLPNPRLDGQAPVDVIREAGTDEPLLALAAIASLRFGSDPRLEPDLRQDHPMLVAGADVWKGRWVVVLLEDERDPRAFIADTIEEAIAALPLAAAIGVDMPIGLPAAGERRPADVEARRFVGPRRNSVFFTPSAELLEKETAAEANVLAKAQGWPGLAAQSFALKKQILAVQPLAAADDRIWEVHPEVSFAEAHGRPLEWPKSTWNGINLRREVLEHEGIVLPTDLGPGGAADVSDVLDAAIAAWSARRIARGEGLPLPPGSQRIGAIWR